MYWFKGDDPLVVRVIDRLFVDLVQNRELCNPDEILAPIAAQCNALYGKVSERFGPSEEFECLVCAFRFKTEVDMLAFILRYQ